MIEGASQRGNHTHKRCASHIWIQSATCC